MHTRTPMILVLAFTFTLSARGQAIVNLPAFPKGPDKPARSEKPPAVAGPAATAPAAKPAALLLEWPQWLAVPGSRQVSARTNPSGRIGVGSEETCPGDIIGKPSIGCLKRTLELAGKIRDAYAYLDGILTEHGYTTQNASPGPYANLQLSKWVTDDFGSFTVREYPDVRQPGYYRQIDIFLRRLMSGKTGIELTFLVKNGEPAAPAPPAPVPNADKHDRLSWPPPRGTWSWALQSVAVKDGSQVRYSTFYFEEATGRSLDAPLPLPAGGSVVGVFPDDCSFRVQDQTGHSFTFKDEDEAKGRSLAAGKWSVFPTGCGGVVLFVK